MVYDSLMADRRISFVSSPGIREALEEVAKKEDRTMSYMVNRILREYLEKRGYSFGPPPQK